MYILKTKNIQSETNKHMWYFNAINTTRMKEIIPKWYSKSWSRYYFKLKLFKSLEFANQNWRKRLFQAGWITGIKTQRKKIWKTYSGSCELSGLPRRAGMLRSNKNEVENDRSGVVNMISFEHKAKWTRFKFLKLRIIKCLMVL